MSCTRRVHGSLKTLKKQTAPAAILEGLGFDIQPCTVICVSTSLEKGECDWLKGQFSGHFGGLLGKELSKHVSYLIMPDDWKGTPWAAEGMHEAESLPTYLGIQEFIVTLLRHKTVRGQPGWYPTVSQTDGISKCWFVEGTP